MRIRIVIQVRWSGEKRKNPQIFFEFERGSDDWHVWVSFLSHGRYSALGQVANDLRDSTFETLSFVSDWSGFSNHFSSPRPTSNGASSVESIHDQVHVTVGGGSGHMR